MKVREIATALIIIAVLIASIAAHEGFHVASEKITGQPVTTITK